MEPDWKQLRINEARFAADFQTLSEIGKTGETGVNRPALSAAHVAAREWLRRKIEPDAVRPRYIHTEPGVGYRFATASEASPRQ